MLKSVLYKRIITSIVLIIFASIWMFIGSVYLEPVFGYRPLWSAYTFMALTSFIFLGAVYEIINLKKNCKWPLFIKILVFIMAIVFLWFPLGNEHFGIYNYNHYWFKTWMVLIVLVFFILVFLLLTIKSKYFKIIDVVFIFTWIIYLVFAFKAINYLMLSQVKNIQNLGWPTLLFLFIIVISNDIGAFVGGSLYGKKKLAVNISPNKTWEGAYTGLATAVILGMVYITILLQTSNYNPLPFYEGSSGKAPIYIAYLAVCFILSVVSQFGDLLFSYLKRTFDVKDFSNLLPGHGGILDRIDSFTAVAIFGFVITLIFTAA